MRHVRGQLAKRACSGKIGSALKDIDIHQCSELGLQPPHCCLPTCNMHKERWQCMLASAACLVAAVGTLVLLLTGTGASIPGTGTCAQLCMLCSTSADIASAFLPTTPAHAPQKPLLPTCYAVVAAMPGMQHIPILSCGFILCANHHSTRTNKHLPTCYAVERCASTED